MLSDFFFRLSQLYSQRFVKNTGDGNGQDNVPKASKGNEEAGKAAHEGRAPRPEKVSQELGNRGTDGDRRTDGNHIGFHRFRASGGFRPLSGFLRGLCARNDIVRQLRGGSSNRASRRIERLSRSGTC